MAGIHALLEVVGHAFALALTQRVAEIRFLWGIDVGALEAQCRKILYDTYHSIERGKVGG